MANKVSLLVVIFCCLTMLACGGRTSSNSNVEDSSNTALPLPAQMHRSASAAIQLTRYGSGYNHELAHLNITDAGTVCWYSPLGEGTELNDMAYAIYELNFGEYEPQPRIWLNWDIAPAATNLWIAYSDWDNETWSWHRIGATSLLIVPEITGYIDESGAMFIVVAVTGSSHAALSSLEGRVTADSGLSPWPMYAHDAQHTGRSPFTGPRTGNIKWQWTLSGDGCVTSFPSVAVQSDGAICFQAIMQGLYVLNPDGSERSLFDECDGYNSPAIRKNGELITSSVSNGLTYIDVDGLVAYDETYADLYLFNPIVVDSNDSIYFVSLPSMHNEEYFANSVNSTNSNIYHRELEKFTPFTYMAVNANGIVYVTDSGKLKAINPDGTIAWIYSEPMWIKSSPVVGPDGMIYVGTSDGLEAVKPDGTHNWTSEIGSIDPPPAIDVDGTVYCVSKDLQEGIRLNAVSQNGELQWQYFARPFFEDSLTESPTIDGLGTVYFVDSTAYEPGYVYAVKPDGELLWKSAEMISEGFSPAIGLDGTLYVGNSVSIIAFQDE